MMAPQRGSKAVFVGAHGDRPESAVWIRFAMALPLYFTGVTTRRGLDLIVQGILVTGVRGCVAIMALGNDLEKRPARHVFFVEK